MWNFLFSTDDYAPHAYCIAWDPTLLWMHVSANTIIALAYFSIPALIVVFVRRRQDPRLVTPGMLFAVFISACGATHLLSALTFFYPFYGIQGLAHVFTAIVSSITAVVLWRMMPGALAIPSREDLVRALDERDRVHAETLSKQKEIERRDRELARKVGELEVMNHELQQFAYAASHDLKSPANTLSLWLREFRCDHGDAIGSDGRESIDDAIEVVERMRNLVEDILIYSRVVNMTPAHRAEVNLREFVESVLADQRVAIRQAGATVNLAIPSDLTLWGYPTQISMLFVNLLANSLTFTAPGRHPVVDIKARLQGENDILVTFADNGIGIEPRHAEKIFRIFSRLHPSEEYEGNGLGLALCKRIAVAHDGRISVTSKPGGGATFEVTLAREPADVATPHAA